MPEVGRWRWWRRQSAAVIASEVDLLGEDQGVASTSIPRYRTVLSSFVRPSRS
jgi:hypothetical protein